MRFSRIGNLSNRYQGEYRRVLAVCSAGLLRSPTIAHTLCQPPYNYNTRSVGLEESYALNTLDSAILCWPQEIVCAEQEHFDRMLDLIPQCELMRHREVVMIHLGLPDIYAYRDPELVRLILERYDDNQTWASAQVWRQTKWESVGSQTTPVDGEPLEGGDDMAAHPASGHADESG